MRGGLYQHCNCKSSLASPILSFRTQIQTTLQSLQPHLIYFCSIRRFLPKISISVAHLFCFFFCLSFNPSPYSTLKDLLRGRGSRGRLREAFGDTMNKRSPQDASRSERGFDMLMNQSQEAMTGCLIILLVGACFRLHIVCPSLFVPVPAPVSVRLSLCLHISHSPFIPFFFLCSSLLFNYSVLYSSSFLCVDSVYSLFFRA